MKPIRVVLADDHALVRAGLRRLLEDIPGITVIGEASDGQEAREMVERQRPDLALLDISMPELNGLEVTAWITRERPETRVIILSMLADDPYVSEALKAGASGYLLKRSAPGELGAALSAVANGGRYLGAAISREIVGRFVERATGREQQAPLLTPRQRQVLKLICEGKTSREIARILDIGVRTVETHRADLSARLGVSDTPGLVRYAMRLGIVGAD